MADHHHSIAENEKMLQSLCRALGRRLERTVRNTLYNRQQVRPSTEKDDSGTKVPIRLQSGLSRAARLCSPLAVWLGGRARKLGNYEVCHLSPGRRQFLQLSLHPERVPVKPATDHSFVGRTELVILERTQSRLPKARSP